MSEDPVPPSQSIQPAKSKNKKWMLIAGGVIVLCLVSICLIGLFNMGTASLKSTAQASAVAQLQSTQTAYPTYTPYPTYTFAPTYTPIIVIVTPTFTSTPLYTPTITQTPTKTLIPSNTPIPSKTLDPIYQPKSAGFYLVNVDIGPGSWKSQGTAADGCYWEITTKTGEIIANHFGMAGGTMYIRPTDFQVQLSPECDEWVFLGN